MHLLCRASVKQFQQAADYYANFQLIRNNNTGVPVAALKILCMQLQKIAPVEGKNHAVLSRGKGKLSSIRDANHFGLVGRQDIKLTGAQSAYQRRSLSIFVQINANRLSH